MRIADAPLVLSVEEMNAKRMIIDVCIYDYFIEVCVAVTGELQVDPVTGNLARMVLPLRW